MVLICYQTWRFQDNIQQVIPLSITLYNKTYLDGEEITVDAVYEAMRSGVVPTTSQISYGSLTKVLDKSIQENEDMQNTLLRLSPHCIKAELQLTCGHTFTD